MSKTNIRQKPNDGFISEKLKYLLSKNKISESELASTLNLPLMTVRRIVHGETLDPRISTLKLIADYFKVPLNSLLEEDMSLLSSTQEDVSTSLVPILNWQILSKINDLSEVNLIEWTNWQPIVMNSKTKITQKAFALESRPSMNSRFPEGTIFIIEPSYQADDCDLVLIKFKDDSSISIRELEIDPPKWILKGLTASSDNIVYSRNKHQIVGVVILTMLYAKSLNFKG